MTQELDIPLVILPARLAAEAREGPFVVIVRSREELLRWTRAPMPGVQWLQVEGLLADQEAWESAAHGSSLVPLDVILSDPATDFAHLYQLADVRSTRRTRVTMPVVVGLMKALRLSVSLQMPVRLLPVQPTATELEELEAAAEFYLRDQSVEEPIEFFHSVFAAMRGAAVGTLWSILEQDPALFIHLDDAGQARWPDDHVATRLRGLIEGGAECATCPWRGLCAGYFKQPDPAYACGGVKTIFAKLQAAAAEMEHDLSPA